MGTVKDQLFQCSSASRKFLNVTEILSTPLPTRFQCSSASRKFLNDYIYQSRESCYWRFSALQRAENSSIETMYDLFNAMTCFSALQRAENSSI